MLTDRVAGYLCRICPWRTAAEFKGVAYLAVADTDDDSIRDMTPGHLVIRLAGRAISLLRKDRSLVQKRDAANRATTNCLSDLQRGIAKEYPNRETKCRELMEELGLRGEVTDILVDRFVYGKSYNTLFEEYGYPNQQSLSKFVRDAFRRATSRTSPEKVLVLFSEYAA